MSGYNGHTEQLYECDWMLQSICQARISSEEVVLDLNVPLQTHFITIYAIGANFCLPFWYIC